jgi:hypothetical protein
MPDSLITMQVLFHFDVPTHFGTLMMNLMMYVDRITTLSPKQSPLQPISHFKFALSQRFERTSRCLKGVQMPRRGE